MEAEQPAAAAAAAPRTQAEQQPQDNAKGAAPAPRTPSIDAMVRHAIVALKERAGSSLESIASFVESSYSVARQSRRRLRKVLKSFVSTDGVRYKLPLGGRAQAPPAPQGSPSGPRMSRPILVVTWAVAAAGPAAASAEPSRSSLAPSPSEGTHAAVSGGGGGSDGGGGGGAHRAAPCQSL
eukprot:COSAG04_NODE_1757_length_5668_cov_4.390734_4_plen_181_part_00